MTKTPGSIGTLSGDTAPDLLSSLVASGRVSLSDSTLFKTRILSEIDLSMMPILFMAVTSEEEDIRFQKETIEDFIQNPLERIPGVGTVGLFNAMEKQIIIAADKQKLASLGLSVSDISSVIAAENLSVPGGNMQIGSFDYTLRVPGEYEDIEEVAETIIANPGLCLHADEGSVASR